MSPVTGRPKVLCVDDEPQVLEGLALHLRRSYDVVTATSGAAALDVLGKDGVTAVIISDMRMPAMDGAAFLSRARQLVPDATRILLTGQSSLAAAIAAVNDGHIFRFLTKPCAPPALMAAVGDGAEQHRLVRAEKVLLEQTLHGSIKAMTDILALANPASFGRALRIKQHVTDLAVTLGIVDQWQVGVAAMLSQLGLITLPPETVEGLQSGRDLSDAEQQMVARMPVVTEQLLAHIPRLEMVRAILRTFTRPFLRVEPGAEQTDDGLVRRGAHMLRVAIDYDRLEAQGGGAAIAIGTMRGRVGVYDPALLDALDAARVSGSSREEIRELPLLALRVGMVLADDVKLVSGPMLVARGYEITDRFVERARNFPQGSVKEPVRVILRTAAAPAQS